MNNILKTGPCLTVAEIKAYIDQSLTGEQLHKVERHLLDCPLCSDAVEGLSQTKNIDQELHDNASHLKLSSIPKAEDAANKLYNRPDNEYDLAAEPGI